MIRSFYEGFHAKIQNTSENAERHTTRVLGKHPQTGEDILVILGRYGAFVQVGDVQETDRGKSKPPRASIRKDQRLETITLEEALELFKLPRELGNFEGELMKVAVGRFGPYVLHKGSFYNLEKTDDPYTIDEARCIEIIEQKRASNAARIIKSFPEDATIQVLNGRYGAYIKAGELNVKIPKGEEPTTLTLERCKELAQATAEKEKTEQHAKDIANALKTFPENKNVLIMNGKYGAYIKVDGKIVKIPKNETVDSLTLARCLELASEEDKPKTKTKAKTTTTTTKKATTTAKTTKTTKKKGS
jgi:DNA topoisomerase-1